MIHYSCDRCRRTIDNEDELRYVVRIEVQASIGTIHEEADNDRDHLLEVHEILEHAEDAEHPLISDEIYQRQRYDLCTDCYRAFVKNPLGTELAKQLDFSKN
jgi:hypothetical protein